MGPGQEASLVSLLSADGGSFYGGIPLGALRITSHVAVEKDFHPEVSLGGLLGGKGDELLRPALCFGFPRTEVSSVHFPNLVDYRILF